MSKHGIRSPPILSAAAQSLPPAAPLPSAAAAPAAAPLLRKPAVRRPTAAAAATAMIDADGTISTIDGGLSGGHTGVGSVGCLSVGLSGFTGVSVVGAVGISPRSGFTPRGSPSAAANGTSSPGDSSGGSPVVSAGSNATLKRKQSGGRAYLRETEMGLMALRQSIASTEAARATRSKTKG
jgi:hypothetical protein